MTNEMPERHTALWYRLHILEEMDRDTMKDMLAFLAGFTETGFDKAYESATGNHAIPLVPDDPDYREDEKEFWNEVSQ